MVINQEFVVFKMLSEGVACSSDDHMCSQWTYLILKDARKLKPSTFLSHSIHKYHSININERK